MRVSPRRQRQCPSALAERDYGQTEAETATEIERTVTGSTIGNKMSETAPMKASAAIPFGIAFE